LLQLIDCIELMKNEVKKKMHDVNERCCTKVTERRARTRKSPTSRTKTRCEHAITTDEKAAEKAAAIQRGGVKHSAQRIECRPSRFAEVDHFRPPVHL
jgi:hypothetical protein